MNLKEKLKNHDNWYYALKNKKVIIGFSIFLFFLILALLAPILTKFDYEEIAGAPYSSPSLEHLMGTTIFGRDVFTQVLYGLRSTFFVGLVGGTIALVIGVLLGFISGYKSGTLLDEGLMMLTNILLVIPVIAILIILSAYLPYRGILVQSIIIGITSWPWSARAVRAQTLAIKNKEFVNLSRISSVPTLKIIIEDIASNMFSYVFMVYILQFAGAILTAVGLDFIGLGPTRGISLGLIMQNAVNWNALPLGLWWWAILPGLILTVLVTSLYFINTGLDEVFNPKLREM
ncbi:peptide ABC transporter permease [Tepiditoga spiralis]|uniref:Peptide ABC transporter permease n=1 Tax=Tepiditoga spiralis TaxID=2108365 RepID=A0A7G1G9L8_9BACT|nr:ABC transporter permease [Tepiditoga spiralis]BBE31663.1 peptide ABC transporter permease [Tepiditoga spiralis]